MDDARAANMPKDNMARAISKGVGGEGDNLEEVVYEGYGPNGVALIVECMTDNRNRTLSDVRTVIQKRGGSLGAPGSVMFGFRKKGQFSVEKAANKGISEDVLLEVGLEHGLEDVSEETEAFVLTCAPENFLSLKDALLGAKINLATSELTMIPENYVRVSGESAGKMVNMIEALEDLDDVQNVYSNLDIDEQELEGLMA
jgi:YebC/PmpR family DNA-binding regulatory protein